MSRAPSHSRDSSQRKGTWPLWLCAAVFFYCCAYSALSILKHETFHSYTFDLGILSQTIWNTSHGRLFETSIDRVNNAELIGSYLGNHVRPILLLIAPIYRLWPDPRMLLVIQSVALGLAAFPLYWITRRCVDDRWAEVSAVVCYLLYPALGYANLFDFHPLALSIPLFFLAYWAKLEKAWGTFWITILLALSTKEEAGVPVAAWGGVHLILAIWEKEKGVHVGPLVHRGVRTGVSLFLIGLLWVIVCIGLIIPFFNGGQPYRFLRLWAHLGHFLRRAPDGSPITPPWNVEWQVLAMFLVHLFLPLGYAVFLGPAALSVSLPSLAYLVASRHPNLYTTGFQYPVVLIPWFFLATVEGLMWLKRKAGASRSQLYSTFYRFAIVYLLVGTLLGQIAFSPIARYAISGNFSRRVDHEAVIAAMRLIPPDAGLATINSFGAHLSHRRVLLPLEYPSPLRLDHLEQVDYVLLDLVDCRAVAGERQRERYARLIGQVLGTGEFRMRYRADRIVLLERSPFPSLEAHCIRIHEDGVPYCAEEESCRASPLCQVAQDVRTLVEQQRPCWP